MRIASALNAPLQKMYNGGTVINVVEAKAQARLNEPTSAKAEDAQETNTAPRPWRLFGLLRHQIHDLFESQRYIALRIGGVSREVARHWR